MSPTTKGRPLAALGLAGLVGLCGGCYDGLSDAAAASAGGDAGEDGADGGDGADDDDDGGIGEQQCAGEPRGILRTQTRRLTHDELLWSLEAIVGLEILATADVQGALTLLPPDSPGDLVTEFQNGHAYEHVHGMLLTAQAIAAEVVADPQASGSVLGACAPTADAACAEAFIDGVGLRITKRPLDATRRASLLAGFAAEGEGIAGMQWLLSRLLQSPEAQFHVELVRSEEAVEGLVPVDDWTVASRLSYALTGRGPDETLLQAAAAGELRSKDDVRPHAERLLASDAARRQFRTLLDSWLLLRAIPDPNGTLATLAGIDPTGLAEEARQELADYAEHLVFDDDSDATALLGSAVGFPRSERMAALYGSAIADGDTPVPLPDGHGGLVLRAATLVSGHPHTSPILRGAYVRKRLLCDAVPPPDPAELGPALEELDNADRTMISTRELAELITEPAGCASCHQLINPLGFALEGFDSLGRRRAEEIVVDADGNELARHPLDTHVVDPNLGADGPTELDGDQDLLDALAESDKVRACLARTFFTYAQLSPAQPAHACAIEEIDAELADGASVGEAWLAAVVNAELFVRAQEDSP